MHELKPFTTDTELTGYMPLPREVLDLDLPPRAALLYAVLLDRGTLSRKNQYRDDSGWVYVIYSLEHLAQTLHISDTAVKRHLRQLEQQDLIRRRHGQNTRTSHIYLRIPVSSIRGNREEQKYSDQGSKMPPVRGRKVPTNNFNQQQNQNNYYQHREEDSL